MMPPALMTPAETERYAAGLVRLAKQIGGRVGDHLKNAAAILRQQSDFGDINQGRYWP